MTETQKKAIYDIVLKSFTVGTSSFSASCVYENQIIPDGRDFSPFDTNATYPLITLRYRDTDDTIEDMGQVVMKKARLSINVFCTPIDNRGTGGEYVNGKVAVDAMTSQILTNFENNYESLFSSGVYVDDRIEGVKVRDISTIATKKHVYRNTFIINVTYEV